MGERGREGGREGGREEVCQRVNGAGSEGTKERKIRGRSWKKKRRKRGSERRRG
jgi:hypothetical protein